MATRIRLIVNVSTPDGTVGAARGLAAWLADTAPVSARGDVTVALVSDRRMRTLNRTFRGNDYATDVLSFPADTAESPEARPLLGDIVIAAGVAARQAREHRHALGTELRVLALHGLLHLLGYDHEDEDDNGRMARVEARLRRKGGLPAGLIARTGRPPRAAGRP